MGGSIAGGGAGEAGAPTGGTGNGEPQDQEDCLNGIDDTGDGLADCADPQCQPDHQCVPEIPPGWAGFGYRAIRSFQDPETDCLGFPRKQYYQGLVSPTTGCTCSCSAPKGLSCEASAAEVYDTKACSGVGQIVSSACSGLGVTPASVRTESYVFDKGACDPLVQGTPTPPNWSETVDLCLISKMGSGCPAGFVCVPRAIKTVEPAACIHRPGEYSCPSLYSYRNTYYGAIDDTRSCAASACSCSTPTASCSATLELYDMYSPNCEEPSYESIPFDGKCSPIYGSDVIRSGQVVTSIEPGECESSGAGVSGTAKPSEPQTVCCMNP